MTRSVALLAAGISLLAFASAAQAADLIVEQPAAPVVVAESGDWDGFYVGVFGGYADGAATSPDAEDDLDLDGNWIFGLTAGANFTLADGVVGGIVADVESLGLETIVSDVVGPAEELSDISYDLYWAGSLRGRLGFDGGAFLPYLTAGLAFASAEIQSSGDINASDDHFHLGWTVGAGVEFAATEDLSIDLLYRYTDYGDETYTLEGYDPADEDIGFTTHQITAGVNWKF